MKLLIATISMAFLMICSSVWAHEGISTSHRDAMQMAMKNHIEQVANHNGNGKFPIYDPSIKTIVQLKFDFLHDSVEVMGRENPYFVTCADFVDSNGVRYDLDFLVSKNHEVVAVLIHAKKGKKIPYDIH
jgi:hypothetical protein